jgi:hypothetical protein
VTGIYFVGFRARPGSQLAESKDVGGAYVNCWIKAHSLAEAQDLAAEGVASEGWVIEAVEEEIRLVTQPDEETRERFDQAEIDGSCYVFHTWPVGDHSEEPLH